MSTIKCDTLANAAGASVPTDTVVKGSAKAWVNFNGTGTVAIRTSFNVSSITDNGPGDYTINITTALIDGDYSIALAARGDSSYVCAEGIKAATIPATTNFRIGTISGPSGALVYADTAYVYATVFR